MAQLIEPLVSRLDSGAMACSVACWARSSGMEMGCGLLLRTEAVCPKAAAVAHRKQRAKIVAFMRLILSGGNCLMCERAGNAGLARLPQW